MVRDPQGLVLGPVLYVLYTADIIQLVESLQTSIHLYGSCRSRPADSIALARKVIATVDAASAWMASNRLRLNLETQYLWLGLRELLAMLDKAQLAALLPALVESTSARDLGVIINTELLFDQHVSKLSQSCFFQLCRLRAIRQSLMPATLTTLVHAFVYSAARRLPSWTACSQYFTRLLVSFSEFRSTAISLLLCVTTCTRCPSISGLSSGCA